MNHERLKRRFLYGATVFTWLVAGVFIWSSIYYESVAMRCWLIAALAIAGALTTAALLTIFVAPLEQVYRSGYEAGAQSAACSAFRPQLAMVPGGRRKTDTVIPIRLIDPKKLTHTDS